MAKMKSYNRDADVNVISAVMDIFYIGLPGKKKQAALECMDEIDLKFKKFPANQRLDVALRGAYFDKVTNAKAKEHGLIARVY